MTGSDQSTATPNMMLYTLLFASGCNDIQFSSLFLSQVKAYYGKKTKAGRSVSNSHELCLELLREQQVRLTNTHTHHWRSV